MKPIKVLILEDREADALLMVDSLKKSDFEPTWNRVDNPEDFLAALKTPLDLILADFALPQFSGEAAFKMLQEKKLTVPFILVSGTLPDDNGVTLMKQGVDDFIFNLGPDALGDVHSRKGRALLALIFESSACNCGSEGVEVGGCVGDEEVFSACFADDARIGFVFVYIVSNGFPHGLEDFCASGEVYAGEGFRIHRGVADLGTGAGEKVNHTVGESGFCEDFHQEVCAEDGC